MRAVGSDVRHGLRLIRRYPASAAIAILTLALGIGANTAIFSVVDAVLLRPCPTPTRSTRDGVGEADQRTCPRQPVSPADFLDWRDGTTSSRTWPRWPIRARASPGGEPVVVEAGAVSRAFFDVLGIRPALGRTFARRRRRRPRSRRGADVRILEAPVRRRPKCRGEQDQPQWQSLGSIGVLPESFHFSNTVQIYATLVLERPGVAAPRASHQLEVYARIKRGVTFAQASDSMDRWRQTRAGIPAGEREPQRVRLAAARRVRRAGAHEPRRCCSPRSASCC